MERAVAHKVAYVPGLAFYPDPSRGRNTMRLNFSYCKPEQIEEGIRRLGLVLDEAIAQQTGTPQRVTA